MATITPTEEDASPGTRFLRPVAPGSVPLPNEKWIRSPKQPDYAICLDPEASHPGWLMLEGWDDNWVSVRRFSDEDLHELISKIVLTPKQRELIYALIGTRRG